MNDLATQVIESLELHLEALPIPSKVRAIQQAAHLLTTLEEVYGQVQSFDHYLQTL